MAGNVEQLYRLLASDKTPLLLDLELSSLHRNGEVSNGCAAI